MVGALAFGLDMPILLLPVGLVYWAEILSVVLQVTYFKSTHGKRLFKMSPIHHHFEMCGWSEVKICLVVSAWWPSSAAPSPWRAPSSGCDRSRNSPAALE